MENKKEEKITKADKIVIGGILVIGGAILISKALVTAYPFLEETLEIQEEDNDTS